MKDLALAVDCGTQSIRVIIFDDQGNLLSKVKKIWIPLIFPLPPITPSKT